MSKKRKYDSQPARARAASTAAAEPPRLRADARRNRDQILAAARDIFVEYGPNAPLEHVASRAGVGIGTLYRRFPDRQLLQRAVALDVWARVAEEAQRALAEEPDAFQALTCYMHRALDLRIGAVIPALVGQISLNDAEMLSAREETIRPIQALIDAAHASGSLRPDVTFGDISVLIIRLARPLPGSVPRDLDERLAHRHLDLLIAGLRATPDPAATALPGPALTLADLRALSGDPEPAVHQRSSS